MREEKERVSLNPLDECDVVVEYTGSEFITHRPGDKLLAGREYSLLEEIEGYPAYGCFHTKPAPTED